MRGLSLGNADDRESRRATQRLYDAAQPAHLFQEPREGLDERTEQFRAVTCTWYVSILCDKRMTAIDMMCYDA